MATHEAPRQAENPGRIADVIKALDDPNRLKERKSGLSPSESAALKHVRGELNTVLDRLAQARNGKVFDKAEVKEMAENAARDLPTRMGETVRAAVYDLAATMVDKGVRDDEGARRWALEASNAAPSAFRTPGTESVNDDERSDAQIIARIPRA
jgi:hypothetical protein